MYTSSRKLKEAGWIKPIAPSKKKSSSSNTVVTLHKSRTGYKPKRFKQLTLESMAIKPPEKTVDLSTLEGYAGGTRGNYFAPTTTPTKVRSAVSQPTIRTTDEYDYFPISDMDSSHLNSRSEPVDLNESTDFMSMISSPSRRKKIPAPHSQASPILKLNNHQTPPKSKSRSRNSKLNCTAELLKDFDKLPNNGDLRKPVRKQKYRWKIAGGDGDKYRQITRSKPVDLEETTDFSSMISSPSGRKIISAPHATSPILRVNNHQSPVYPKPKSRGSVFNCTADLLKDFDKVPNNVDDDGDFRKCVRKQEDRRKLDGGDCDECRQYYLSLKAQMHPSEFQRLINNCSRHRSRVPTLPDTPTGFWSTTMPTAEEALRRGILKIGVASPPARKKRFDKLL